MKFFKKPLAVLLTLAMVIGIFAAVGVNTSAAEAELWVGGVEMNDGDYLANGATTTTTSKPSGGYAYFKDGKLTLSNFEGNGYGYGRDMGSSWLSGVRAAIWSADSLDIVLEGENKLYLVSDKTADFALWAETDIAVSGDGSLDIDGQSRGSSMGIVSSTGDITYNAGVAITVKTGLAATWSVSSEHDGDIIVNGADYTVVGGHNGGLASDGGDIIINSGNVVIERLGNGISGKNVTINGGNISVKCKYTSSDTFAIEAYGDGGKVTINPSLKVQASVEHDGTLGEYVAANNDTYGYIVITGHVCTGVLKEGTDAECEKDGFNDYYECECGKYYADEDCTTEITDLEAWKVGDGKIEQTGHDMQMTADKVEPKCEDTGTEAVYTCANGCGKTEGGEVIPETGHTWGEWQYDDEEHWQDCACGESGNFAAHSDSDSDSDFLCDSCDYDMYVSPAEIDEIAEKLAEYDEERVTKFDEDELNEIIAEIDALLESGTVDEADTATLNEYKAQAENLIEIINDPLEYFSLRFFYLIVDCITWKVAGIMELFMVG